MVKSKPVEETKSEPTKTKPIAKKPIKDTKKDPKAESNEEPKQTEKDKKYAKALAQLKAWLAEPGEKSETDKQLKISEILSEEFNPEMSFVGFYDKKPEHQKKIYIGEYVSNADIYPGGVIDWGKGQCGQCAAEEKTLVTHDTKQLENYIACDDDTRSEIVVPCFDKDGKFRTVLDIDSPDVGNFTDVDKSDYVKERCSQDEICVPLHYSKIGCANMASLRNTTVNKLSKTTNQSFQPKMKLLDRYADSSEKKTVALFLEFQWFVVKKKMCSQLLPGVNQILLGSVLKGKKKPQ